MTLPADVYAWRPTRVQIMAKRNSNPGVTFVQMRPATATLAPSSTVIEHNTLTNSAMAAAYAWKSFSFTKVDPMASGGAICLVFQNQTGAKSATVQSTSVYAGLQKTGNSGSTWSYDSGKCLVSQLYGKLTRSGGAQSLNSNYLISLDIALRMISTSPTLQTTAAFLNHPELLSGKWELKFDQNPTSVDTNGDGAGDWTVNGGGTFNMASLVNGVWQTNSTQLNTSPNNDFIKTTIVDLKFQNTSVGGNGATFSIHALRSGDTCAPILAYLKKQLDGTQTLTLATKISDDSSKTLLNITGLPNQQVLLHLIIDPVTSSVSISANEVQYGTFRVAPFVSSDSSRSATIGADGSNAEFTYARVRSLEN